MNRREFIAGVGAAAMLPKTGWAKTPKEIRALLLHLGSNMWCDWFPPGMDSEEGRRAYEGKRRNPYPALKLRTDASLWRESADYAAAKGLNMIIVDVGEGVVLPSHPELAIEGSWTPDQMRAEIERLNGLGLEVIPKLNFSATHNGWLKEYRRMLSTSKYYRVCEDVLRDVYEIFNSPRFIHIGYDEETPEHQEGRCNYVVVRKGDFWWHDFLHIVRTVEKLGARPWAWADYGWDNADYFTRCPKSVLQATWYYDEDHGGFDPTTNKTSDHKRLMEFWRLEEAGFDQTPCGTNWVGWKRKEEGVGADDVIGEIVKLGRKVISPAHRAGFVMAPWKFCDKRSNVEVIKWATDLFAAALAT